MGNATLIVLNARYSQMKPEAIMHEQRELFLLFADVVYTMLGGGIR